MVASSGLYTGRFRRMTMYLGTSGWQYRHWRETFYPKGLAQARWLEYFMERFQTVEINNAFYRLPSRETFEKWRERTPDDFVFAVKANRYMTHIKRLKDSEEPVVRYMENVVGLGPKLGPILIQLPPNLKIDLDNLDRTLGNFGKRVRIAVEFRHESWYVDETRALLEEHGAGNCWADRGSRPVTPLWRTADWGFLRFHEGAASPHPCYGRTSLQTWADRLAATWGPNGDTFVYFNNDPCACALRDARWFHAAATRAGLSPTRIPDANEVRLCT